MDGLTFASKINEAVVWPITVAFLVFKFRDRVGTLLDKLVGLKLPGGIEANFRDEIAAAEKIAEQVELPVSEGQAVASPSPPDPNEVRANPTGVIMESWIALTRTAVEIATLRGYSRSIASPDSPLIKPVLIRRTLAPGAGGTLSGFSNRMDFSRPRSCRC